MSLFNTTIFEQVRGVVRHWRDGRARLSERGGCCVSGRGAFGESALPPVVKVASPVFPAQKGLAIHVSVIAMLLLMVVVSGCALVKLPPPNLTEAGWTKRSGQVVWTQKRDGLELVADVNVWVSGEGRCWLEVNKSGLPFLTVQLEPAAWKIESADGKRSYSGKGHPPTQSAWPELAECLRGGKPRGDWSWSATGDEIALTNKRTGERIEGFLAR